MTIAFPVCERRRQVTLRVRRARVSRLAALPPLALESNLLPARHQVCSANDVQRISSVANRTARPLAPSTGGPGLSRSARLLKTSL